MTANNLFDKLILNDSRSNYFIGCLGKTFDHTYVGLGRLILSEFVAYLIPFFATGKRAVYKFALDSRVYVHGDTIIDSDDMIKFIILGSKYESSNFIDAQWTDDKCIITVSGTKIKLNFEPSLSLYHPAKILFNDLESIGLRRQQQVEAAVQLESQITTLSAQLSQCKCSQLAIDQEEKKLLAVSGCAYT